VRPSDGRVTSAPAISYPAADRAAASRRALDRLAAQQGGEARRCCRDDAHYRSLEPERGIGDAPPAHTRRTTQALRRSRLP